MNVLQTRASSSTPIKPLQCPVLHLFPAGVVKDGRHTLVHSVICSSYERLSFSLHIMNFLYLKNKTVSIIFREYYLYRKNPGDEK